MATILLLCWRDLWHPQGGGSERYIHKIGSKLAHENNCVVLVTARYPGARKKEHHDGITIIRMGGKYTVYVRVFLSMIARVFGYGRLAKVNPDVIIDVQNGIPFFTPLISKKPVILLVHHCHRHQWHIAGRFLKTIGWWIESSLSPKIYRHCQYLTVSQPSCNDLISLGVNPHHIAIARAGVDCMNNFSYQPHSHPRLVTLSRLVPHKQIEHSIDLIADLHKHYPHIVLDIIGNGWWEEKLRTYVHERGLQDHVIFHGYCSEEKKYAILSQSWFHVMPSRAEGWCLAVTEAASIGVPSIGYLSSGGLCDSIIDGQTGILTKNYSQLLEAAHVLLADSEYRKQLSTTAYAHAQELSWDSTVAHIRTIIHAAQNNTRISSRTQEKLMTEQLISV